MAMSLGRRIAVLVVTTLTALMMVAGPALADPGHGKGVGQGVGGGKLHNHGKHKGGGHDPGPF